MSVTFKGPNGDITIPGPLDELVYRDEEHDMTALYASDHWRTQARDPGGEHGGEWVEEGGGEDDEDYRGYHVAPDRTSGSPLHDIANEENGVFPDDIYGPNGGRYYQHFPEFDEESLRVIRQARGNPDMPVTVYRAVPAGVADINPGDWVTPSRSYAETHADSGNVGERWTVISKEVPARELYSEGNSIHEFGWDPDTGRTLHSIQEKHQAAGVELWASESQVGITLSQIKVPAERRGQGLASQALKDVLDYADRTNQTVALTVGHDPQDKGLTKTQKTAWYKRHGFVPNKGRNKDFGFTETMVRKPVKSITGAGWPQGLRAAAPWMEARHPRHPAGSSEGGEFSPKGGVTRDESGVETKMRDYVNELYQTLADRHPEEYPYDPAEVDKQTAYMMSQYQEAYAPAYAALEERLAGIPGVTLKPALDKDSISNFADLGPHIANVRVGFDVPEGQLDPDFFVWHLPPLEGEEFPSNAVQIPGGGALELHDVLDISDTDFFPAGQPDLAGRYADALDDVRGIKREGYITLHRGMSVAEADAWARGEEIPTGKFFTSSRTANLAQDVAGEFPELYSWKVAQRDVIETEPGVFQLRRPARLKDETIESLAGAVWMEAQHPRDPGGEGGGRWIEKGTVVANDSAEPVHPNFPRGVYDMEDSVVFWPEKIGNDPAHPGEPLWKAFVDEDGNEVAFWFADQRGRPHHDDMLELWDETGGPTDTASFMGSSIAGYGDEVDLYEWRTMDVGQKAELDADDIYTLAQAEDWHTIHDRYGYIGADIDGLSKDEIKDMLAEEYLDRFRAVPRRHRRDIKDARAMLEGLQAAANPPTLEWFNGIVSAERERLEEFEPKLSYQYERIIKRLGRQIARRFRELAPETIAAAGHYDPNQPRDPGGEGGGQWIRVAGGEMRLLPADDEWTQLVKGARMRVHDEAYLHERYWGKEGVLEDTAGKDNLVVRLDGIEGWPNGYRANIPRRELDMIAHPGSPLDEDTQTAMRLWRSDFSSSLALRAIIEGREPAPAYRDSRTLELATALDQGLENSAPLGQTAYRIVPGPPPAIGSPVRMGAAAAGFDRGMVEDYRRTFLSGPDDVTVYKIPSDAHGLYFPDGQEAIVRGDFDVTDTVWNEQRKVWEAQLRSTGALTSAVPPASWGPPTVQALLAQLLEDLTNVIAGPTATNRRIFEKMVDGILRRLGLSFDIRSIISQQILNGLAARSEGVLEGIRVPTARIIANSWLNGLSVPQTADALVEGIDGIAEWQATQLARNDLIGMSNGGSLLAAKMVNEAYPGAAGTYKEWLATEDERTRPTHNEAHGQRVPLETPFVVGGAPMQYPGDPSGPDQEVINCRCTLIYFSAPKPVLTAAFVEQEHPRDPGGDAGGEFIAKGSTGVDEGTDAPASSNVPEAAGATLDEMLRDMGAYDMEGGQEKHPERYMKHPKSGFMVEKPGVVFQEPMPVELDPDGWGRKPPRIRDVTYGAGFAAPEGFENLKPMGYNKFQIGEAHPPAYLYRAISEDEWLSIQQNGHIQSDQRMNLSSDEGTVTAFSDPSYYLPGALASDKPGRYEGRVIRIAYRDEDGWRFDRDGYVKTSQPVPLSQIDMVTPKLKREVTPRPGKDWNDIGPVIRAAAAREYHRWPKGTPEEGKKAGGRFAPVSAEGGETTLPQPTDIYPDFDENGEPDADFMVPRVLQNMQGLSGHRERVKNEVIDRLTERLKDDPNWHPEAFDEWKPLWANYEEHQDLTGSVEVDALIQTWSHSASDSNLPSLLVQQAVADEFGLDFDANDLIQTSMEQGGTDVLPAFRKARSDAKLYGSVRAFVRAQYAETQEFLAHHGEKDLLVWRGMSMEYGKEFEPYGMSVTDFDMNPASSWAISFDQAHSFAYPGGDGMGVYEQPLILGTRVPNSRILSTALTGQGCLPETEVLVIGAGHGAKDQAYVFASEPGHEMAVYDEESFRVELEGFLTKKKPKRSKAKAAAYAKNQAALEKQKQKEIAEALGEDPEDMFG